MELIPGWQGFELQGESAGEGAKNEFHRKRMAYYVKVVKQQVPTLDNIYVIRILQFTPVFGSNHDRLIPE